MNRQRWIPLGLMLLAAGALHQFRLRLAEPFHELRATSDVYPLPSPEHIVLLSLGYRSALADLIYAHVLVSYGLHFQEKRLFASVGSYLKAVNELDPKYLTPYLFADTLLVLQPQAPPLEHYHVAREILLRGTREHPFDTYLWMSAGQYLAYLAPPHLRNEEERRRWRQEGARLLMRACELQSTDEAVPHNCLAAAGILNRSGQHEANIRFLQRFLAVNDDPEARGQALAYLRHAVKERGRELVELNSRRFREAWRSDLGFAKQDLALVVGPGFDPIKCAVRSISTWHECPTSWRAFGQRADAIP
jgi:hypothetical protein